LLLAARAFCQLFPEKSELITDHLAAGFCRGSKDAAAGYTSLLRVFALGHVFETGRNVSKSPAVMGLEAFNTESDNPADVVATAPYLEARFTAQNDEVLEQFKVHVHGLVNGITELGEGHEPEIAKTVDNPIPATSAICTACQGDCCRMGVGKNAFIERHVVGRMIKDEAQLTSEDVANRYLNYVPDKHVVGSCFYHGQKGCELPREMRSDICNGYTCGSVRNMLRHIEEAQSENVLCIAGEGSDFRKATRVTDREVQEVPVSKLNFGPFPTRSKAFSKDTVGH